MGSSWFGSSFIANEMIMHMTENKRYEGRMRFSSEEEKGNLYLLCAKPLTFNPSKCDNSHVMLLYDLYGHSDDDNVRGVIIQITKDDYPVDINEQPMVCQVIYHQFSRVGKLKSVDLLAKVQYSELVNDNTLCSSEVASLCKLAQQAECWFKNLMHTNNVGSSWSDRVNCHSFVHHVLTKEINGLDIKIQVLDMLKGAKPEYERCVESYLLLFDSTTDLTLANCIAKMCDRWEFA